MLFAIYPPYKSPKQKNPISPFAKRGLFAICHDSLFLCDKRVNLVCYKFSNIAIYNTKMGLFVKAFLYYLKF